MPTDESDDSAQTRTASVTPAVGRLRLIALDPADAPARRRAPRRRLVVAVGFERRQADRRRAKPGIDGLLRTVLADDWE